MSDDRLPRLVFFRRVDPNLPEFIRLHLRQQVDCLSRWFDVVVIGDDCDYAEICDRYEPDMALFESGVYAARRTIANTDANPRVPKLGFLHSDAYCVSRTVFMSDMQRWGVDEFVTISVAMGEYTPEIADRLFVWPNFVDDLLYRDHGLPKAIPVLFTGSQAVHYPWRNRVSRVVSANYPTMTAPHLGWFDQRAAARMVHGERYARMLNAAYTVPTCGTIAKDLVRKHLEIPAAAACLVTERTAAVEAAGFVDMDSCVFADEDTVLDKLDHLFAHPDELARITAAGHDLVHRRHTAARRDEIRQWYDLKTGLRPGQRIVQPGPFQRLVVADASGPGSRHVISGGVDRLLLREAARAESTARYADAEHLYRRCLNFHFMAEPLLGLARCRLYAGDPQAAIEWLVQPPVRRGRPRPGGVGVLRPGATVRRRGRARGPVRGPVPRAPPPRAGPDPVRRGRSGRPARYRGARRPGPADRPPSVHCGLSRLATGTGRHAACLWQQPLGAQGFRAPRSGRGSGTGGPGPGRAAARTAQLPAPGTPTAGYRAASTGTPPPGTRPDRVGPAGARAQGGGQRGRPGRCLHPVRAGGRTARGTGGQSPGTVAALDHRQPAGGTRCGPAGTAGSCPA